jgi:oxygen-independent coproporphyrinogen-3 oxidase
MAGIYVHIPFCRSRCIYCGFYSTTGLDLRQRYVDAVCREISIRGTEVCTIYLGGGTPSQLTIQQLRQIFDALYIYNKVEKDTEVTIEVNPDDITEEYAKALTTLPVNRISMGIQTFDDQRLHFLRRRHTSDQAVNAVKTLRHAGFQNISIDLMYGFPDETLEEWNADLSQAIALNVEHISTYCLMIEDGTPLYQQLQQGHIVEPDEELERQMYEVLMDRLQAAGYEHYEISNFARKGYRSLHNSSYWTGIPYIGIGAAAHSYDLKSRSWNVADIHQYIEGMERGERIYEEEVLNDDTRYNDTITVALRTKEGIDLSLLTKKYHDYLIKNARRYMDDGLLELNHVRDSSSQTPHLRLTRRGLFVSDMVMSDLMMV